MYLGLVRDERTSLPDLKRFADEVGAELEKSPWVTVPVSVVSIVVLPTLLAGLDRAGWIKPDRMP